MALSDDLQRQFWNAMFSDVIKLFTSHNHIPYVYILPQASQNENITVTTEASWSLFNPAVKEHPTNKSGDNEP